MKIKIKRFDKSIPLPEYKTEGAACMDMYLREDTVLEPNTIGYLPLNVAIEIPKNYWVMLAARSSLHKLGLIPANGIGVIDSDFNGDGDEYKLIVFNTKPVRVKVEKGSRVAQILICSLEKAEVEEVDLLNNSDRGGLGTTGLK